MGGGAFFYGVQSEVRRPYQSAFSQEASFPTVYDVR